MKVALSTGEISHPFFTPEGLHIIKVIDRKENPSRKSRHCWGVCLPPWVINLLLLRKWVRCKNVSLPLGKDLSLPYRRDKHVRTAGETVVLGTLMEGDTGLAYSGYQSSFDLVDPCVYVLNYYDTYDFRTRNGFSAYNFPEGTVSAIGNLTGSILCTHGSSGFIYSAGLPPPQPQLGPPCQ